jgi:hypothetical protein
MAPFFISGAIRLEISASIGGQLIWLPFSFQAQSVSKYKARDRRPPLQSWKTFLRNHAEAIAAIDICVVPTLSFERLFAFLVLGHGGASSCGSRSHATRRQSG